MGTRHLIKVVKDNEIKIAQYGQYDGYLEGQGLNILKFLKDKHLVDSLKSNLKKVRFLDEIGDKDFIKSYDDVTPKWSNESDNRTDEQKRWFSTYMHRDLGSKILNNITESEDDSILLENSEEFTGDVLFCEWIYTIDFDKNRFEIFDNRNLREIFSIDELPNEKEFLSLNKKRQGD